MRKIVVMNWYSLDGFFTDLDNPAVPSWVIPDPEVDKTFQKFVSPDTMIFGRITYAQFEAHWPAVARDESAPPAMRHMAQALNNMKKIVFSKTLQNVTWQNSVLLKDNLFEEVSKLKQEVGKDIVIFGSGTIVQQLTDFKLIDEYVLSVVPTIVGTGKPMFSVTNNIDLELLEAIQFKSGIVILHYKIKHNSS